MAEQDALPKPTEQVKVRNTTRTSLLVHVPGQSIHLPPGKTADVSRAFLETEELATLLRRGALALATSAAAGAPGDPAAPMTAASDSPSGRQTRKR